MRVELLYFDGCPNHEALLPELRELLAEQGVEDEVELRRVETAEDAERERFLGSPTVRIDGSDVEPGAGEREDFGLKCRLYRLAGEASGTPPRDLIAASIRAGRKAHRDE
ncbi:MAG: DUF2703 domain-containing protein [Actinobacteria bacterium]|nr:DUF2703 domain-containing protein [Actinomycetota bacterium]